MHRTDWSAETSWDEVKARARGRRSWQVTQRVRAEARRQQIRERLAALRRDVWAQCEAGEIPRVTVGGISRQAVTDLAERLGVAPSTIREDIRAIDREDMRRQDLAQRLPALREEAYAQGARRRLPKDTIWRLAREFDVHPQIIRMDIRAINACPLWRPPRRTPLDDPRFPWTRSRPRPTTLPRRLTVRLPEELYQALIATGDASRIIRQALEAYLDSGSHHSRDTCARVVVSACDPETIDRLVRTSERLELPLSRVLASLLLVRLKEEA
jgi:hypothetical protein